MRKYMHFGLVIPFTLAALFCSQTQANTCAQLLEKRDLLKWIWGRNHDTKAQLDASPNKKPIEKWLRDTYDKEQVIKSFSFENGANIKIIDRGLGRATELVMTDANSTKILFSNLSIKANNQFVLNNFEISPDRKTVAFALADKGSTDRYRIMVIDIESFKIIQPELLADSSEISWVSPNEFVFDSPKKNGESMIGHFDRRNPDVTKTEIGALVTSQGNWSVVWRPNGHALLNKNGSSIPFAALPTEASRVKQVAGETETDVIVVVSNEFGGSLVRINKQTGQIGFFRSPDGRPIIDASAKGNFVLATTRWGSDRTVEVFKADGTQLHQIPVPNCCSVSYMEWQVPGSKLKFYMNSLVAKNVEFVYDVERKAWETSNFESAMLVKDGIQYVTEVVQVQSGNVLVPMRLTRRADLTANGKNPTLFQVYGGFDITGNIDPFFDVRITEFVKRGGIYAAPALRGGNEYGPGWHFDAMFNKKSNTMLDLISSAQWMTQQKWTNPKSIIATGGSNGGLTVASSGLLAPESFGLIIPIAGVHNLLEKEQLDPNMGPGWMYEYGDARTPEARAWLSPLSPVHIARTNTSPKFLVVVGRNDSRVNPMHSYQLTDVLRSNVANPQSVQMISINNSGHWLNSLAYQDLIAWRTNVIIWTNIFDFAGWKF